MDSLQLYIRAAHKGDVSGASEVARDPVLLAYARNEIQRLSADRGGRPLFEVCHENKIRCQALQRLLVAVEALNGTG